jgi:hypothetical protein
MAGLETSCGGGSLGFGENRVFVRHTRCHPGNEGADRDRPVHAPNLARSVHLRHFGARDGRGYCRSEERERLQTAVWNTGGET